MTLGRVKWFGGSNKNTGRINDFGFFNSINDTERDDIYVSRQDVPLHIQQSLEPGTYVEFEVCEDKRGHKYATNVELVLMVGTVGWFSKGIGSIRSEGYADIKIESSEKFESDDVVAFHVRYDSRLNKNRSFLVQKIDDSIQDEMLIEMCARSNQTVICKPFIARYANSLSESVAIEFVEEKIKTLSSKDQQTVLKNLAERSEKLFLASSELRQKIKTNIKDVGYSESSASAYWHFVDKYVHPCDSSINQELLAEVRSKLDTASEETLLNYWKHSEFLKSSLEYRGNLWNVAPVEMKLDMIRQRYRRFFESVSEFEDSAYPFSESISRDWKDLYNLDDVDKKLTELWCSSSTNPREERSRMISARGAEKLVLEFLRIMGHKVEDIAAHQSTQQSAIWKKADIEIDSRYLIDVKNARSSVNSSVYSEFCVPKFKQHQVYDNCDNDVFIAAVLSPYLQSQYVISLSSPQFFVRDPLVLGLSNAEQLKRLEDIFIDDTLSISLSRDLDPKRYLPPWLFDYSNRFYEKQREVESVFSQLGDEDMPDWEDICLTCENPLPLFIATRRPIHMSWVAHLPSWQVEFIQMLANIQTKNISLPYLFLALLKHFLRMVSLEELSYSPQEYADMLYPGKDSKYSYSEYSFGKSYKHPLKIYDPLDIIQDFCKTLQCLWEDREETDLKRFKIFKFTGKGLVQGKQSHSDPWTTLLAYCGGYIKGKGKCGYTPLVIGQHHTCAKCGNLICPKKDCRYCSQHCKTLKG